MTETRVSIVTKGITKRSECVVLWYVCNLNPIGYTVWMICVSSINTEMEIRTFCRSLFIFLHVFFWSLYGLLFQFTALIYITVDP